MKSEIRFWACLLVGCFLSALVTPWGVALMVAAIATMASERYLDVFRASAVAVAKRMADFESSVEMRFRAAASDLEGAAVRIRELEGVVGTQQQANEEAANRKRLGLG